MNTVIINISGGGLTYQGDTTVTKAAQVIAFLNAESVDLSPTLSTAERTPQEYILEEPRQKISPRQSLVESEAKSNSEKIAAFAYYLQQLHKEAVTIAGLKSLFSKSGEPVPRNFSRDLKDAVRSNYIYESEKGEYELTEFGIEAVEHKFVMEKIKKTERKRSKTTKAKNVEVSTAVQDLDLGAVEPGYPAFHSLNKGQQILWVCVVADAKGVPELNYKEVVYIIDRLKGNITTGTLTALNEGNIKKGYLKQTSQGFKVTQVGIDKIKELG